MASPSRTMRAASRATATFSAVWRCSGISKAPWWGGGGGTAPPRTRWSSRRRSSRSRSFRTVTSETPNRSARSGTLTWPASSRSRMTSCWRSRSVLPGIGDLTGVGARAAQPDRRWGFPRRSMGRAQIAHWPVEKESGPLSLDDLAVQASELVLELEDLLEQDEPLVGGTLQPGEERGHLGLPADVDLGAGHGVERCLQVIGLDVADQEPVVVQEQAVVAPAGLGQGRQHLRPDGGVAAPVLVQVSGAHP